jgi:hypothetical protein
MHARDACSGKESPGGVSISSICKLEGWVVWFEMHVEKAQVEKEMFRKLGTLRVLSRFQRRRTNGFSGLFGRKPEWAVDERLMNTNHWL